MMQGMMISAREENNETGIKKIETHDADKQRGRLLNLCLHNSVIQIQITIALLRSNLKQSSLISKHVVMLFLSPSPHLSPLPELRSVAPSCSPPSNVQTQAR